MNDERLIQLLRETPPEDLSRDEIHELRRRLPRSGELRQALFEQLQLDQALSETLGGLSLSPESIVRRAATAGPGGAGRLFGWGTISAVLLGLTGVGVLVALQMGRKPPPAVAARAVAQPADLPSASPPPKRSANADARRVADSSPARAATELPHQEEEMQAAEVELPRGKSATSEAPPRSERPPPAPDWFEPLVDVNDEAYNALSELSVALRHQQWRDACRVIAAIQPSDMTGLTPDAADPNRLTTMEAFVAQAINEHAELRQTLEQEYGAAAWQHFRQAADEDDVAGVEAVAIGLQGTAAAQDARRWLGDRALAAGRFRHALAHYRATVRGVEGKPSGSLAARVRLAGAMLGQDLGAPPEESIEFDGEQLSPTDFERLVIEMRSRDPAAGPCQFQPLAPPPGSYTARVVARFDVAESPDPGALRPIGLARAAGAVIVSNGYGVAAFDAAQGNRRWVYSLLEPGKASAWPAEAMAPLVSGASVYVRLIGPSGPELVCLSIDTGQSRWEPRSLPRIACEPVRIDDRFVVCQWHDGVAGRRPIDLVTLDAATGRVIERRRLAWQSGEAASVRCTLTVVGDSLVFATGDVLIAADLQGRPRWARRSEPRDAPPAAGNSVEPPCVLAGADGAYCCHPGDGLLQCIELSNGAQRWRRAIDPVRRLVAASPERLTVQTERGIHAYDAKSGETRWSVAATAQAVVAAPSADDATVLLVEAVPLAVPRLRWFDSTTGQQKAESALEGLSPGNGKLAPCSADNAAFWLSRVDPATKTVELIELRPL